MVIRDSLGHTQTDAAPFPTPGTADTARSTRLYCNGNGHFKSYGNCTKPLTNPAFAARALLTACMPTLPLSDPLRYIV
jgi:hypothetical protein